MKKKKTLEIVGDSNGGIAGTKIGKDILHVVASALFCINCLSPKKINSH